MRHGLSLADREDAFLLSSNFGLDNHLGTEGAIGKLIDQYAGNLI
jgi:hypothetical protein